MNKSPPRCYISLDLYQIPTAATAPAKILSLSLVIANLEVVDIKRFLDERRSSLFTPLSFETCDILRL